MTSIAMENMDYKQEVKNKTSKPLLWIGIVSIVMFFGGLTSAVIVSQGGGGFINIALPDAFLVSTIVIVLSSIAFHLGLLATKKGKQQQAKMAVLATMVLGLTFVFTQYLGWSDLVARGYYLSGTSQESSYLYLLTILHVLHLIGGLVSLSIVLVKTFKKRYTPQNYLGVEVSITYWHFLGGLWIYLFFFLMYITA
ncbi:MAG: cytochrome c oxidase subunit 3 [Flavobacteriales bacterium]|nr:cytochrome c oxidase subunit 3 [Flavobacteriales bacterium]